MGYESIAVDAYENLEEALSAEMFSGKLLKLIECAGAYYCAVEKSSGHIGAVVVLERLLESERLFKEIDEEAGPIACTCPIEILRLLSPTKNAGAVAWRERCWTWNIEVVKAALNGPLDIAERLNAAIF